MSADYYLWLEEQAKGPFTIRQLRTMWGSGQLTSETRYTMNDGDSWSDLADIVEELESLATSPQTTPPIESVTAKPEKISRLKIALIVILTLTLLFGLYLNFFSTSKNQVETPAVAKVVFPVEIKLALNSLKSATDVGVNQTDYKNLVISLKTCASTYGSVISQNQKQQLYQIITDYDNSVQLWRSSYTPYNMDDLYIMFSNDKNTELMKWLVSIGVNVTATETGKSYLTTSLLSQIWSVINKKVEQLLANN